MTDYYQNVDIKEAIGAAEIMGFDLIKICKETYGYTDAEVIVSTFLDEVFARNGERDPLESLSVPKEVKRVYRQLTLIQAKDIRWKGIQR